MKKILIFASVLLLVFTFIACGGNEEELVLPDMDSSMETEEITEEVSTDESVIDIVGTTWELFKVDNIAEWQGEDFYYAGMNPLVFQSGGTILTQEGNDYTYTYEQDGNNINIIDEYGIVLEGYLLEDNLIFYAVYEGREENTILFYYQNK